MTKKSESFLESILLPLKITGAVISLLAIFMCLTIAWALISSWFLQIFSKLFPALAFLSIILGRVVDGIGEIPVTAWIIIIPIAIIIFSSKSTYKDINELEKRLENADELIQELREEVSDLSQTLDEIKSPSLYREYEEEE